MSEEIHEAIKMAQKQNRDQRRIRALEETTDTVETTVLTDTTIPSDTTIDHDHAEFLTRTEIQDMIDKLTTPQTQSTTGITSTGAGTTLDCSDKSYNIMKMTCIGQTNTGTFTSASVDLELSANNADWEKVLTITPTTADPHVIDFVEFGAKYMRYNVTAISLVGDSDLDIELEALV